MLTPVWANDVSEQGAVVYEANSGAIGLSLTTSITSKKASCLSWVSLPCQDLSLVGFIGEIHASRSGLVWE